MRAEELGRLYYRIFSRASAPLPTRCRPFHLIPSYLLLTRIFFVSLLRRCDNNRGLLRKVRAEWFSSGTVIYESAKLAGTKVEIVYQLGHMGADNRGIIPRQTRIRLASILIFCPLAQKDIIPS